MSSFYFTLSSLPYLGTLPLPINGDQFLELCRSETTEDEIELLRRVVSNEIIEHPLLLMYQEWEHAMRYELARLRAQKLGWGQPESRFSGLNLADTAKVIFLKESPLEAEETLDRMRLEAVEALSQGVYFQWENLLSYALRLAILTRQSLRAKDSGVAQFEVNYNKITQIRGVHAS